MLRAYPNAETKLSANEINPTHTPTEGQCTKPHGPWNIRIPSEVPSNDAIT